MRILFLTYFRRKVGGTESYLQSTVPACLERGHDIAVCYTDEGPLNRQPFDFPNKVPQWGLEDFGSGGALQRIKTWCPDLIFCHGTTDMKFEAEVLKLAPGIFFAHNYATCISGLKTHKFPTPTPCSRVFGPACLLQYFPRRCGGNSPITMMKLYVEQSHRLRLLCSYASIATNSEYLAQEYRRHGLPARCLYLFAESNAQGCSSGAPGNNVRRLLFVGRMDRLKGGLVLLQALPEIRSLTGCDLQLVLVGDGPERQDWERNGLQIQATKPGIHIEFKGWLEKSQLALEYAAADLLLVPSLWPEPFGLVGIEAGLYGVPAVAFAVGGIPEWLHDGENGYLAPGDPPTAAAFAQAAARALDPKDYQNLRVRTRKLAQRWTLEKHCTDLDLLFASTVREFGCYKPKPHEIAEELVS